VPIAELAGLRVGYDAVGEGVAVVVCNGLGADRSATAATAQWLASEGFRAVTLDNPGAGESERAGERCSIALFAAVAAELLDLLGTGPAHLFGHSMGGAIAQELALARPDLVRSLQLHCTWGRTDPYTAALFTSWGELADAVGPVEVWRHMLLWAMTPEFYAASPEVVAGWLGMIASGPPSSAEGFRDHVRACVAHDALDRLGAVTVPTLVTAGERDLSCRPAHAEELRAAIPHASFHVWQGVGHLPFVESPAEFASVSLDALRVA
jgi:3-oxoadipate enol-lactonase